MGKKRFGHLTPQQIQQTVVKMGGDLERAGKWLGCSSRTLRRYIHELGLSSILGKTNVPRDRDTWTIEEERKMVRLMREEIEKCGLPVGTTKVGGPAMAVAQVLGRTTVAVRNRWNILRSFELRAARAAKRMVLTEKELMEAVVEYLSRKNITVVSSKWANRPRLTVELG